MTSFLSRFRNSLMRNTNEELVDIQGIEEIEETEETEVEVEYSNSIIGRYPYKLINNNNYHISVYWGTKSNPTLKYLQNLRPYTETSIRAYPSQRFVIIPVDEFIDEQSTSINMETTDKIIIGDYYLEDFENKEIHIIHDYTPPKSELDQWKEAALKSQFLLKELERLGAKKNENFESIMDMIQDIHLPNYTELDKEQAGIPSTFTNV